MRNLNPFTLDQEATKRTTIETTRIEDTILIEIILPIKGDLDLTEGIITTGMTTGSTSQGTTKIREGILGTIVSMNHQSIASIGIKTRETNMK